MAIRSDSPVRPIGLPASSPQQKRITTWACYLAFLGTGAGSALIGPSLVGLSVRFGWPLENTGWFTAMQSAGIMAGVLLGGALLEKFGARGAMIGGTLLACSGLWLFSVTSVAFLAMPAALAYGIGFGLLSVGPNVIIQILNPSQPGSALNRLNVFYSVGAIIGPQVANFGLDHGNYAIGYMIIGAYCLLVTAFMARVTVRPPAPFGAPRKHELGNRRFGWLVVLPFAVVLFVYVGIEVGYTSWISTQMQLVALSSPAVGAFATSLFWIGLTIGRINASFLLRYLSNQQLLLGTSLIVVTGVSLLLIGAHNELLALGCTLIVGIGLGPVFPTTFALAGIVYPPARAAMSGVLIAVGSFGAILLPPLQGHVGGGLNGGIIVTFVGALALVGLFTFIICRTAQSQRKAAAN